MLTEDQKHLLFSMIEKGEPLPAEYRRLLFAGEDVEYVERTGVYTLEYKGKAREQDILADTPAAPLQEIRSFNADNPHAQPGWRNLLIYADNLLALKALYEDQCGADRFGTRDRIKLIYIDPPFATKQDYMKDREKAYRDKLIGAQFIEFLRKRLVLLREILANDGSIYVHLDQKKGHYVKVLMDEVFGEENFVNEIVWQRSSAHNMRTKGWMRCNESLFFYRKTEDFVFNEQIVPYGEAQLKRFKRDENGRPYKAENLTFTGKSKDRQFEWRGTKPPANRCWGASLDGLEKWWAEGIILTKKDGRPRLDGLKIYLDETRGGNPVTANWTDVDRVGNTSDERTKYPTQKPEVLLERVIKASSNPDDIVLDAFSGSGATLATAEKLGRRWIGVDCGRLAIYTTQKRLLNLTTQIGAARHDDRREVARIEDFAVHTKLNSKAALILFDKAAAGELEITDALLTDFAAFLKTFCPTRNETLLEFSLFCPEKKLSLYTYRIEGNEENNVGVRTVEVGGVRFLISFIEPKVKATPAKPLIAKHFSLFNSGVYDRAKIRQLDWSSYKPFVMQLFGVREASHPVHAFQLDGYIGTDSVHIWNFPDQRNLTLDEGYVRSLHELMRGLAGDRLYIIAPVSALDFMTDELRFGNTRYIVLKVPDSVLNRLLAAKAPGALKQPMSELDVNAVVDAAGFDFVSQPLTDQLFLSMPPENPDLTNQTLLDAVVRLTMFRAKTLTTSPEDFPNFATLSMVLVDPNFDGDVFSLGHVLWAEDLVAAELKRLDRAISGDHATRCAACQMLDIRIPLAELGERAMVIMVDQYGNEKRLEIDHTEFGAHRPKPSEEHLRGSRAKIKMEKGVARDAARKEKDTDSRKNSVSPTGSRSTRK